jgi:hypothetical protein
MGGVPNLMGYPDADRGGQGGSTAAEQPPAADVLQRALAEQAAADAGPVIGDDPARPAAERKLIRDAALTVGVASCSEAVRGAQAVAAKLGGYVQEATGHGAVLRVPADRFDAALDELSALGLVSDRKVQVRDVTEEYVDLELRLKNKRATLARLEALATKADKVEDLLKIEQETSRLMLEIEQLEGKLRLMASQVALSHIAVEFVESAQAARGDAPRLPFGWLRSLGLGNLLR